MAAGAVALLRPTDLIVATGDKRTIDGVEFEFQMAPNSEAPAEMHFFIPRYKLLNLAENCTHNFHNLLPFRGADVRDALAWSKYLGEALQMWGGRADAMCGQHHWPVWGHERIDTMIRQQRDSPKSAQDQPLRLMNHGLPAPEIAETLRLPKSLDGAWHGRGYYGHIRHNVKAIYQKYLGWYDANPVNLDPLPPVESGKKYVEYMGGADAIMERARKDFSKGEFRFVAQAVSHLVFADPDNQAARAMLADTFEQLGYASESSTWRNAYLFGAQELRNGMPQTPPRPPMPRETLAALRTEQLWDVLGVRLNGPKAEGKHIVLNWTFTDTNERFALTLENCALTYAAGVQAPKADAGFTMPRALLDEVITHLFGNPGTTELPIMHALKEHPDLTYVMAMQESLVVAIADGFSRASGRLVACNVHVAPGLGNAMGSLYNAKFTGTPMILTAGQQEQGHGLTEPVLYDPLVRIAEPLVKWAVEVTRLEDLPRIVRRAAKVAMTPPTGPVFISLPGDILNSEAGIDLGRSTRIDARTRPSDEALKAFAARLLKADRPVIITMDEVVKSDALDEAAEL